MIGAAGIIIGIALARLAGSREAWLRTAVLAQTADLVTFAVIWDHGEGELNPLGRLAMQATHPFVGEEYSLARVAGALLLIGLKLGLMAYLIRVTPYLGRYHRLVLVVAVAAGAVGAVSNVVAYPNASLPLIVVGGFAVVAIRWPGRFREAVGAASRLVASGAFAIGGLAAMSFIPYADEPWLCGSAVCSPMLGPLLSLLAVGLAIASLIMLWITLRYAARFVPIRFTSAP